MTSRASKMIREARPPHWWLTSAVLLTLRYLVYGKKLNDYKKLMRLRLI